jgi:hypothetical protein
MDFFDFFALFPIGCGGSSRERSSEENLSGGIALTVFPLLDFMIVLFAGAWRDEALAFFLLPALFTWATVILSKLLETSGAWTATTAIGCALMCLVASGIGGMLAGLASFFSSF